MRGAQRVPPRQGIVDDGDEAYGDRMSLPYEQDVTLRSVGSCCSEEYATDPGVQRAHDDYVATVRQKFLREVFGPGFSEDYLRRMIAAWKDTIASVADMKTIVAADQAERIALWRQQASKGRSADALLANVKITRGPRSGT